ncbi:hypothetical protein DFH06DRAFT_1137123 [Mycena polygramma]|nr:hypothetical protein DFH06DRAFT_1137123 [Mycena polygramma]
MHDPARGAPIRQQSSRSKCKGDNYLREPSVPIHPTSNHDVNRQRADKDSLIGLGSTAGPVQALSPKSCKAAGKLKSPAKHTESVKWTPWDPLRDDSKETHRIAGTTKNTNTCRRTHDLTWNRTSTSGTSKKRPDREKR